MSNKFKSIYRILYATLLHFVLFNSQVGKAEEASVLVGADVIGSDTYYN